MHKCRWNPFESHFKCMPHAAANELKESSNLQIVMCALECIFLFYSLQWLHLLARFGHQNFRFPFFVTYNICLYVCLYVQRRTYIIIYIWSVSSSSLVVCLEGVRRVSVLHLLACLHTLLQLQYAYEHQQNEKKNTAFPHTHCNSSVHFFIFLCCLTRPHQVNQMKWMSTI